MATIRIINEEEDSTLEVENVGSWLFDNPLNGYKFYVGKISHKTEATVEDLFQRKNIIAVKPVGKSTVTTIGKITATIATGGLYNIYSYVKKKLATPNLPNFTASSTTSATNAIGDRSNEPRLNERIEDIWGTESKAFPSLLSRHLAFDDNRNEVEIALLSIGDGEFDISDPLDGDYDISSISTTTLAKYEPGTDISVVPDASKYLTSGVFTENSRFTPMVINPLDAIDAVQIYTPTHGIIKFYEGSGGTPYLSMTKTSHVSSGITYTATITCVSDVDWSTSDISTATNITLKNFSYTDGTTTWTDNSATSVIIQSIATNTMIIKVKGVQFPVLPSGYESSQIWYNLPLNTQVYLLTDGSGISPTVSSTEVALASKVTVDTTRTNPTYLCNFVCENGTANGNIVLTLHRVAANGSETTETKTCVKDNVGSRRVGYTWMFNAHVGSVTTVYFYFTRVASTDDAIVFRDISQVKWLSTATNTSGWDVLDSTFIAPRTTILRLERRFNSIYGAGDSMKLSVTAKRKLYPVVVDSNNEYGWYLNTSGTPTSSDYFPDILANLHYDQYNGRQTNSSLDYPSLVTSYDQYVSGTGITPKIGITFDDNSTKYEEEVQKIIYGVNCNSFQMGSRIYSAFEKAVTSPSCLFTHRDIIPGTQKKGRIFRKENNYDHVKLTYKDSTTGDSTIIYMPSGGGDNPLEITVDTTHTLAEANVRLYREYYKLLYQRKTMEFSATSLGRIVCPGMVIAVEDTTTSIKGAGEIVDYDDTVTIPYITTSQTLPSTFDTAILTNEDGSASVYSAVRTGDYTFYINSLTSDIYTGWEKNKTRYLVYTSTTPEWWIVDSVDAKSYDEVEISCINYDDRYYQNG